MSCDSLVALGSATADGVTLLAKNSDRPPDECQPLVQFGRQRHSRGATLRCQYIEIPQVEETAAIIGSQPFWLWGFEHGLNEHGVAIGNHTVFTKDPLSGQGLLGMDLVRLGLERGKSARQATEVITTLIEAHGQGGSGFLDMEWPYHNSFLIADRREAYLLETSDRRWAARRIRDVGSASNHVSIGRDWDALSSDAIEHAVSSGWWPAHDEGRFDFAAAYRDVTIPAVVSSGRFRRSGEILAQNRGRITAATLRGALRDHYDGPVFQPGRTPDDERFFCLCRHDPINNSVAGMVAHLPAEEDGLLSLWGCLGSPCIGIFLPYYIDGQIPPVLAQGGREATNDSPWWKLKQLLTLVEGDFARYTPIVSARWKELEEEVTTRATSIEAKALAEQRAGRRSAASKLLTDFMSDNVTKMLKQVDGLISSQNH